MGLELSAVTGADEARLAALFELYVYDFSEILPIEVGEDGRFAGPSLAPYFGDPERHGFLLRVEGKLAGFALVSARSRLSGALGVFDLAEFFVLRRYRRQGVGEAFAGQLFDRFVGPWEVRQRHENTAATAFWRRVIGRRVGESFLEEAWEDAKGGGVVQRFESLGRAGA